MNYQLTLTKAFGRGLRMLLVTEWTVTANFIVRGKKQSALLYFGDDGIIMDKDESLKVL